MAVEPVKGVPECPNMSQMEAETKILIYKMALGVKMFVINAHC